MQNIIQPTLLVDKRKAIANIRTMTAKALAAKVRFRPHFKTHQSAEIGNWFRDEGTREITVSSLDMALYFADHGWDDITVAIPVNILEIEKINALAARIRLNLVVEASGPVLFLHEHLKHRVGMWIKVNTGYNRAGIDASDHPGILRLCQEIAMCPVMEIQGLMAHAGHTYQLRHEEAIQRVFDETLQILHTVRLFLAEQGFHGLHISVGDTPGCSVAKDWSGAEEVRPGNFVFYDVMQMVIGSCSAQDVAVAMACPVIACYPERGEVLIYGGGVHFSKEMIQWHGEPCYGLVTDLVDGCWGQVQRDEYISGLSQEHGKVKISGARMKRIKPGDLMFFLPVHSCMTADLMRSYTDMHGHVIEGASY
ncbi:MAG: alanine racemase [Flavobacteriales bacterium]|nr:alanine racemase [Flavobacteriales bacterium]MCB9447515.1 alanine racemase [Flavobacteriales bacterium]